MNAAVAAATTGKALAMRDLHIEAARLVVPSCWYALANGLDLDYGYVIGGGKRGGGHRVHEDIMVELPQVLRLLDEMLEARPLRAGAAE